MFSTIIHKFQYRLGKIKKMNVFKDAKEDDHQENQDLKAKRM
jgi:hypothetical protein